MTPGSGSGAAWTTDVAGRAGRRCTIAGVFKRTADKKKGKDVKWTCWWTDENGETRQKAGTTDKATSQEIARKKEAECRLIKEGLLTRKEVKTQEASRRSLADHVNDYRLELVSKGDGEKHCNHIASTLKKLLEAAGAKAIGEISSDRVRAALGRMVAAGKSARTANHAMGAARAFTRWLAANNRLSEDPLRSMTSRYNEDADARYRRRDLSIAEVAKLLDTVVAGPDYPPRWRNRKDAVPPISGPERAMAYRIAMGTGFRAGEIATLTPENFNLGPDPSITVKAAYTKNKREAVQPIRRDLADLLRPWLAGKAPGKPVLLLPEKTAKMLHHDLKLAGIPVKVTTTERVVDGKTIKFVDGVVDFHALRASYITHLIESGATIKTVQDLARHSDPTLTIRRYAKTDDRRKREALDGLGPPDGKDSHD